MSKDQTPFHGAQASSGARFTDFHGWELPLQFSCIAAEHAAVRSACGIFDVSHMGRLLLAGDEAGSWLDHRCGGRANDLAVGRSRYALLLAEDGGVIDDVIVSRLTPDRFQVVVNGANRATVLADWADRPAGLTLTDTTRETGMVAIQGPGARSLLARIGIDTTGLRRFAHRSGSWSGTQLWLSRTGYTGEDGAEVVVPATAAADLWQELVLAGASPCGLGARDTLRLEAALPLYGQELSRERSPVAAGLDWAVAGSGSWRGHQRILQERATGCPQVLVGLAVAGRRPGRPGYPVLAGDEPVGLVTSGTLAPHLGRCIALAYVDRAWARPDTVVAIDLRGRGTAEATVVPLPFYRPG